MSTTDAARESARQRNGRFGRLALAWIDEQPLRGVGDPLLRAGGSLPKQCVGVLRCRSSLRQALSGASPLMRHRTVRDRSVAMGLLGLLACGCSGGDQSTSLLEQYLPISVLGREYVRVAIEGECQGTDCPGPSLTVGYVVDCADLDSKRSEYEGLVRDSGFSVESSQESGSPGESGSSREYAKRVEGDVIAVKILDYRDASEGPVPNVGEFSDNPKLLVDQCSIVIVGSSSPSEV